MEILILLLAVLVVPTFLYFLHERGRGSGWGLVAAGEEVRGAGAYRVARVRNWKRGTAPGIVHFAALSSFFLGQMIFPGGLAAIVGLIITLAALSHGAFVPLLLVLQLSSPTGLVVAARLLDAGGALLARAEDAPAKARLAARWAIGHNLILLPAIGLGAALEPEEAIYGGLVAIYAVVSLAQALVVRRAAGAIEAYVAHQEEDPAPAEVEMQILGEAR